MEKITTDRTASLNDLGIGTNRPIFPYDVVATLNAHPVYGLSEGLDIYLDLGREIILSDNYYYQAIPFPIIPDGQIYSVAAYATMSGSINVPAFAYLTMLTHYTQQPEGFRIRVYDKGAKTDLYYNQFAKDIQASAQMSPDPRPATTSTEEINAGEIIGPRFLISPFISLPPGTLQLEMTNLAPVNNLCQILFHFAIPFSSKSVNVVSIKGN